MEWEETSISPHVECLPVTNVTDTSDPSEDWQEQLNESNYNLIHETKSLFEPQIKMILVRIHSWQSKIKHHQLFEVSISQGLMMARCFKTLQHKKWMKINSSFSSTKENRVNPLMSTLALNPTRRSKHTPSNRKRVSRYSSKGEEYPLHNKNLEEFYSSTKKNLILEELSPLAPMASKHPLLSCDSQLMQHNAHVVIIMLSSLI